MEGPLNLRLHEPLGSDPGQDSQTICVVHGVIIVNSLPSFDKNMFNHSHGLLSPISCLLPAYIQCIIILTITNYIGLHRTIFIQVHSVF